MRANIVYFQEIFHRRLGLLFHLEASCFLFLCVCVLFMVLLGDGIVLFQIMKLYHCIRSYILWRFSIARHQVTQTDSLQSDGNSWQIIHVETAEGRWELCKILAYSGTHQSTFLLKQLSFLNLLISRYPSNILSSYPYITTCRLYL